jgi:glycosyltransferase involved in cell wall biosynthesis
MRICCITKDIFAGGAGKSLLVVVANISENHDVFVLSKNRSNKNMLKKYGVRYIRIKSGFYPFHYLSGARKPVLLNYLAWLARTVSLLSTLRKIRKIKPDIVILNGFQCLWYAPFVGERSKVVLFAREILNWHRWDALLARKILNKYVDCVIAITENESAQLSGVKPPIHVVYNSFEGIISDLPLKKPNTANEIKIGVFGTIHRIKGQYLVVEFVERFLDKVKELRIKFFIYGGASKITTRDGGREQLINSVKSKHLDDYISFPGWVSDISTEMKKMDIILRTDTSGCPWGRDIIEAMSNAKPIVAAGSSQVFIKNGVTGLLFPILDIEMMAEKIFLLAEDPEKRLKMGSAAFEFAKEKFDVTKNSQTILKILEGLLCSNRH